jgi:hypothetical protein
MSQGSLLGPRLLEVYGDTVGRSRCRGATCGQLLIWAELVQGGKRMCFNGDAVVLQTRTHPSGRPIEAYDFADNHWAHCPDSKAFGRK